ncbi:hypothetical protein BH11PSE11_BH11PSE11_18740 [soil metagenome]
MSQFFYNNFRRYFVYTQWRERRFTTAGKFAVLAMIVSAILGVNTRQALAYQVFGLLLALLCAAMIFGRRFGGRVNIVRTLPRYATVGEEVSYRLRVSNADVQPVQGLSLLEVHHDPRPDFRQFMQARDPGAARRNRYDNMVGYYRWTWLVRMNQVAHFDEIAVPVLPAGASVDLTHRFTPAHRGTLSLRGVALARRDALGLCRAVHELDLPGSVMVLPRTYRLPSVHLPGQRHYQPEHRINASASGDGEEISGLREYRLGDALRDIHWKSFARTGTPMVKEYQAEFFERHALLLDTMGAPDGDAFEEAVSLAASFVGDVKEGDCLLDLLFVGAECYCFTMGPGELQAEALMRVLAGVRPCPDQSLRALHATVLSRRTELSGCICILLAWDAERRQMLEEFQQLGLPVLVLLVSAAAAADCPAWIRVLKPGQIEAGLAES